MPYFDCCSSSEKLDATNNGVDVDRICAGNGCAAKPGGPSPTEKLIGVDFQDHREPSSIVECQDFECLCRKLRGNSDKF